MKTKILFFAIMFVAFVFTQATGQNRSSNMELGQLMGPEYIFQNAHQTENNIIVAGRTTEFEAIIKLFEKGEYSVNLLAEWNIEPAAIEPYFGFNAVSFASNDNILVSYGYSSPGYDLIYRMETYSTSETQPLITKEFMNGGFAFKMINDGSNHFGLFYAPDGFNPMGSGIPAPPGTICAIKLSDQLDVEYCTVIANFEDWYQDDIMWMPNGNIAVETRSSETFQLIEIDAATGDFVQVLIEGTSEYDVYKYCNGHLIHTRTDGAVVYSEDLSEIIYQTSWEYGPGVGQLFNCDEDGKLFTFTGQYFTKFALANSVLLSDEIIPEEKFRVVWPADNIMYGYSYLKQNNSVDVLADNEGVITLHRISEDEDPVIPLLSNNDPSIHSVYIGQVFYDSMWQECSPNQSTIVFFDDDLPSVGSMPDEDWFDIPSGMEIGWLCEVEEDEGGLFFRTVFEYQDDYWARTYVKIMLEKKSDVITTIVSEDVQFEDYIMSVYPNPAIDIVNVESNQDFDEVHVYDLTGRKVLNVKNDFSKNVRIDVSGLSTGTYVLSVMSQGRFLTTDKLTVR